MFGRWHCTNLKLIKNLQGILENFSFNPSIQTFNGCSCANTFFFFCKGWMMHKIIHILLFNIKINNKIHNYTIQTYFKLSINIIWLNYLKIKIVHKYNTLINLVTNKHKGDYQKIQQKLARLKLSIQNVQLTKITQDWATMKIITQVRHLQKVMKVM